LAKSITRLNHSRGYKGARVLEVSEDHRGDTYRLVYTVRPNTVYAVHAFKKKSKTGRATPQADLHLIDQRLKEVKE